MKIRLSALLLPLLAAACLTGAPVPGHAQGSQIATPAGMTLTPAQQARAQARLQQFAKDVSGLQADKTMTPAQKSARAKALYQKRDADMLAILTPAQRTQVLAQRKAVMARQTNFANAHKAEITAGSALAAKLNQSLTAAQKTQIADISKQLAAQGRGLGADKTMSPQAKQQKWISAQQDAQTKIVAILTPAQKADYLKMQTMRKQLMSEAGTPRK